MVGWGNPGMRTMEETQHRVDYARGNALRGRHDIVRSGFGRMAGLIVIASVAITGLWQVAFGKFPVQGENSVLAVVDAVSRRRRLELVK
jgi:hypothetical protein